MLRKRNASRRGRFDAERMYNKIMEDLAPKVEDAIDDEGIDDDMPDIETDMDDTDADIDDEDVDEPDYTDEDIADFLLDAGFREVEEEDITDYDLDDFPNFDSDADDVYIKVGTDNDDDEDDVDGPICLYCNSQLIMKTSVDSPSMLTLSVTDFMQ